MKENLPDAREIAWAAMLAADEARRSPCQKCSKLIVESGIAYMWLLHDDGWRAYTAEEFHRLTLQHCGLD